jgi:hypothetical protein
VLSNVVLLRNPPSGMNIQAVSVSMDHVAVISSPGDGIQLRGHYWYGGNYTFTNGLVAGSNSGLRLFAANAYLAGITLVGSSSNWAGFQADDETSATLSGLIATGFDHGIRGELGSNLTVTSCDVWGNTTGAYIGTPDPTGVDGNISVDPGFVHTSSTDPWEWDLHLSTTSPLVDAGPLLDPDGSPSDIGAFGGPGADGWDLDGDGWMQWWQPGPYDSSAYPAFGLDCDDLDPLVSPPSGC